MIYIQLDDSVIPSGNFTFIYDVTKNEELFDKFLSAEKNLKVDYMDFAHKMRLAYEAFAIEEEAIRRKGLDSYNNKSLEEIKEDIISDIKKPASIINYKSIIIDLCNGKEMSYAEMLLKYSFVKNSNSENEVRRQLKAYIRYLYAYGSVSSHENVSIDEKYVPNKENCLRVVGSFHDFLCVYYGVNKKFDSTLVPIRDYIPVPKSVITKMHLQFDVGKSLFVREKHGKVKYYIFSSNTDEITNGQRRDIDVINKLWEDNFEDPSNIIRQTEQISGSNGDYVFQVYSLPNKPLRLTTGLLNTIEVKDKLSIIYGLCKGIFSIHNYDPPLYYRNINPDAFYIFSIRGNYKPLLAKFDCTKDTEPNEFTVFQNVKNKTLNSKTNKFFAPEVLKTNMGDGVNWEKADIYSLGKTCVYILTSQVLDQLQAAERLESISIPDETKMIIEQMLSYNPNDRPSIQEVLEFLVL